MTTWILMTIACACFAFAWLIGLLYRWCSMRAFLVVLSGFSVQFVLLLVAASRAELGLRTERIETEAIRAELNARRLVSTEPNDTERIGWNPTADERYAEVFSAIGPPPAPDAVPVLGYTTKGGAKYPPRWRKPPDGDKGNNLKR